MKKDLPKIYQNPINRNLDNTQELFYDTENRATVTENYLSIIQKINRIFSANDFVYKKGVIVTTATGKSNVEIIGRSKDYLFTLENQRILISDIIDIEEK